MNGIIEYTESGETRIITTYKDKQPDAILLSRSDAELFLIDLPHLSEKEISTAIQYRLSALYPGTPEKTAFAFCTNGAEGHGYKVFTIKKERLNDYRSQGLALVHPSGITGAFMKTASGYCILSTPAGLMLDRYFEGKLCESFHVKRKKSIEEDVAQLLQKTNNIQVLSILYASSDDEGSLERYITEHGIDIALSQPLSLFLKHCSLSMLSLFRENPGSEKRKELTIRALRIVIFFLSFLAISRYKLFLQKEDNIVQSTYNALLDKSGASLKLAEDISALRKRLETLTVNQKPATYQVLSELIQTFGNNVRILTITFKDQNFEFEAIGTNALESLSVLEENASFHGVILHSSIPQTSGGERFSISGSYSNDPK